MAEKGGSRTLRGPYGPQTGFEDQRHHRAPSFSFCRINSLTRIYVWVKEAVADSSRFPARRPSSLCRIVSTAGNCRRGSDAQHPCLQRFLRVAALCNGTIVNFTNVGNDAQVARTTVYEYFEILKDTLVLHELPGWKKSKKRKPLASSKFYFFDVGVVSALQGRELCMNSRVSATTCRQNL
jgi:hypothetical protein